MGFDEAFERTLEHEGVLSDHAADRGGLTKYGISKAAYPDLDIASLTIERAKEIYRRDYWDRMHCDTMHEKVAEQMFDFAVNSGVGAAVRAVQEVVGTKVDGVIGAATIGAAAWMDQEELCAKLLVRRCLVMLRAISKRPENAAFAGGWANRIEKQLELI